MHYDTTPTALPVSVLAANPMPVLITDWIKKRSGDGHAVRWGPFYHRDPRPPLAIRARILHGGTTFRTSLPNRRHTSWSGRCFRSGFDGATFWLGVVWPHGVSRFPVAAGLVRLLHAHQRREPWNARCTTCSRSHVPRH